MRMATFNLLHGRSPHDGQVDPHRITTAITNLDADILALQEVDRGQPRSAHHDLTALAAAALAAATHRFAAAIVGTPGDTFRAPHHDHDGHDEPCYGVSLISRYPARHWQITRLDPAPVRSPVLVADPTPRLLLLRDEPRVLLTAVLDTPHGPVTVAATHLSFVPGWNVRQLRAVTRSLRALPPPRLLLGDLNLPAGLAAAVTGWQPLARRPTYPTPRPRVQLDHILLDPHGAPPALTTVTHVATPALDVSDHRPLVVTVTGR
ncbi:MULTISPECIES: endonuclease/exonuclease/phosphatase family protein [unclassified Solwaraspora]|uniref:endonuclease/exonuclease/phosphatase family protein n=1 Tax=unclassified Solwaraspora TaxID=2627926 RepID=UPI00259B507E|nr:endonuclease/exonuclease/phosphatase family protein [Solwaraspora sp. WMMA2056]WJK38906.1 endonuclease/exonuclease/phosphatase family protein [Solwaraspora sp. WMMA2056]